MLLPCGNGSYPVWRLTEDGRLGFSLEGGAEGGKLTRVGGFTAARQ